MHIQPSRKSRQNKLAVLFLPEDTTSHSMKNPERYYSGTMGWIKFWLWVVIAIGVAVSIGQL